MKLLFDAVKAGKRICFSSFAKSIFATRSSSPQHHLLHRAPFAVRDAFVPPAQAVFAGFVRVAERQRAFIVIRFYRVDGEKGPVAAVDAAFYPDAVMAVFFKVDAYPVAGSAQFYGDRGFRDQMLHGIGFRDYA